jgi:EAL domain-containing protein (putative c-di-GMP-specific phosphodiesterase class I)
MAADESAIAHAVEHDELVLHYQPIVDVRAGSLEGYEALVRWDSPGAGLLPPGDFIPVAEASDLICDVDTWVLNEAARQLAAWNAAAATSKLVMAVNISGRHLNSARILADVAAALGSHDIDPGQLILEITETVFVEDGLPVQNLHRLRGLGVALSLDDFGTGHHVIDQLRRLPVDIVKIDKGYLDVSTPDARERLAVMVDTCHTLGLAVIGEGVENRDQLALLQEFEVESAQGFLLGRPLPAADLPDGAGAGWPRHGAFT